MPFFKRKTDDEIIAETKRLREKRKLLEEKNKIRETYKTEKRKHFDTKYSGLIKTGKAIQKGARGIASHDIVGGDMFGGGMSARPRTRTVYKTISKPKRKTNKKRTVKVVYREEKRQPMDFLGGDFGGAVPDLAPPRKKRNKSIFDMF